MPINRLLVAAFGLLLTQYVPANASAPETISQLGCPAVSQAGVARQSWSVGGSPYGVPLAQWGQDEFGLLRTRIADCAKQSGTDVRGLLAYVQRLESMTRSQNSAADPMRRQAAVDEAHRRSQALNDAMEQATKERERAYQAEKEVERAILEKVEAFTSSADLTTYCRETSKSLPDNTRWDVVARCKAKLALLAMADRQAEEAHQAEASAKALPELLQKLQAMPANEETVSKLQYLHNNYRLPSLSYHDQNSYLQAIDRRLGEISERQTEVACGGVVSRIAVPDALRDALVIDGLAGVSMTEFLCGPALTTRNVTVRLAGQDRAEIKVEDITLTFARRRYLADDKVEVALDSPVKGGVNALVLVAAASGTNGLAIGNPNFFVINFYSQFTPQVAEFLKQQSFHSDASAPIAPKTAAAGPTRPTAMPEAFVRMNCQMKECAWGALSDKSVVKEVPNGKLVRATMRECSTYHPDGEYPEHYACRPQETQVAEYAAFCSTSYPSVAYRQDGKWQRTKLSISEDGQFGYNIESITQYLRICHDYVRSDENLDAVGVRFGYKSRISALGNNVQDAVGDVSQLIE
jgi:hypothetical protein